MTKSFALNFKPLTRDRYVAYVINRPAIVSISVYRDRRWRRLGRTKPWHVEGFGDQFVCMDHQFATIEEAMAFAERWAADIVRKLAEVLRAQ